MVRILDVEVELDRRGVSGGDNNVAGRNKVNKHARLGSAWVLLLSAERNQRTLNKLTHKANKISR